MYIAWRSDTWIESVEVQLCKLTDAPELRDRVGYNDQLARLVAMRIRREARAAMQKHERVMHMRPAFGHRTQLRNALAHWWPSVERPNLQPVVSKTSEMIARLDNVSSSIDLELIEADWRAIRKDVAGRAPDGKAPEPLKEIRADVFAFRQISAINRLLRQDAHAKTIEASLVDLMDQSDPGIAHVSPGDLLAT